MSATCDPGQDSNAELSLRAVNIRFLCLDRRRLVYVCSMNDIATIDRDELKTLLDDGADIRLVMTLHEWAYNAMHIPGSIQVQPDTAVEVLDVDDEIIVYCSDVDCVASQFAYRALVENGFTNVRRYAGGLSDWQAAGYPLEGTAVDASDD